MTELVLRILCLCITLAGAETLHGVARVTWLVPRIGATAAQRVGILTGSLLAFLICLPLIPPMGLQSRVAFLGLGAILAVFMAAFDLALARFVARRSWKVAFQDFNPAKGGLLVFGLAFLFWVPLLVAWIRS
ncbi:MAG TPA: hypothetical protein VJ570_04535 [Holophagaceae bacterium]|nr:hypothetical protein [Holophagaceae bacterium]